jgi:hypothetical protein
VTTASECCKLGLPCRCRRRPRTVQHKVAPLDGAAGDVDLLDAIAGLPKVASAVPGCRRLRRGALEISKR